MQDALPTLAGSNCGVADGCATTICSFLQVWPLLVDYFYKDSITVNEGNALALLSLSRQLLVSSVDAYCLEFIGQHLHTSNCIRYLRKAVKHNISDIQQQCVALAAQGTPADSYRMQCFVLDASGLVQRGTAHAIQRCDKPCGTCMLLQWRCHVLEDLLICAGCCCVLRF